MIKSLVLATFVGALSVSAVAANDWRTVSHSVDARKINYDWNSIKEEIWDIAYGEQSPYFEIRFRETFVAPQKLKSGKYFTTAFYTFAVDCERREYAKTDFAWYINGQKTAENYEIALSAAWEEFKVNGKRLDDIQATHICRTMIG